MKHLSDSENPRQHQAEPDLKSKSVGQRVVNGMLALTVLAWLAVLLAWSALHIFIVPRIDDYRAVLQQQASRVMGVRVDIGSMQAQGGWWVPWFEINDIRLFDREGRETLRLPRVLAAISPLSALRGKFDQIDIESPRARNPQRCPRPCVGRGPGYGSSRRRKRSRLGVLAAAVGRASRCGALAR